MDSATQSIDPSSFVQDDSSSLSSLDDDVFSDNAEDPVSATWSKERERKRKTRLYRTIRAISAEGWSLDAFLISYLQFEDELPLHRHRTKKLRHSQLEKITKTFGIGRTEATAGVLMNELDQLTTTIFFGDFTTKIDIENLNFEKINEVLLEKAPYWDNLLSLLLLNKRSRNSYRSKRINKEQSILKYKYILLSIINFSRQKSTSNLLPTMLGHYLHGLGAKRRILDLLASFGICHSYTQIRQNSHQIAELEKARFQTMKYNQQTVIAYDNMNFMDTKRDETLQNQSKFTCLTTAVLVNCPQISMEGLHQKMHNPTIPLEFNTIYAAPSIGSPDDGIRKDICRFLITRAIEAVHSIPIKQIFKDSTILKPSMPVLDRLKPTKTEFHQFPAIWENEGTIDGTYKVHDEIFLRYLNLSKTADNDTMNDFASRLWLVHGDQMTIQRIRATQSDQIEASEIYDRRQWMLGVPAWFHIKMNLLNTIMKTHFKPPSTDMKTKHSVESDAKFLARNLSIPSPQKYHILEPLVRTGFNARVLMLFYIQLQHHGYLSGLGEASRENRELLDNVIGKLTPEMFSTLINNIYSDAFSHAHWDDDMYQDDNRPLDIEYRTMCRYLQEVELFLTTCIADKHGDIGLLRRLVDPLIINFIGAAQRNYTQEMLYYRWNLTEINTPELQYAILASGLVNWEGKPNSFKAIDLGLEHLNSACSIDMKTHKNSTHTAFTTFDEICVMGTWNRSLRYALEQTFGRYISGDHTRASVADETFSLARNLLADNCGEPRPKNAQGEESTWFDSINVRKMGLDNLYDKIESFNDIFVINKAATDISDAGDSIDTLIEYATEVHDGYDSVVDIEYNNLTEEL